MRKILTLIFYFNIMFFFFNIKEVNTIDDIALIYDDELMNEQKYYNISFYDFKLSELNDLFKNLNVEIISVTLENYGKIEFTSVNDIIERIGNDLINEGKIEQAINLCKNNFKIKSMVLISTKGDILELEKRVKII